MFNATVTSQGQITIPAEVRRRLHLRGGDKLTIDVNAHGSALTVRKLQSLDEITTRLMAAVPKGIKPLTDADDFYQETRKVAL